MNVYAESSAILSWLLGEGRRATVRRSLRGAELIVTSDLTLVECDRVLLRAAALKEISSDDAESRKVRLRSAAAGWYIMRVGADVIDRARRPFPIEPIRTLDAIHLASAWIARTAVPDIAVLSLDQRIRTAARELDFPILPRRS